MLRRKPRVGLVLVGGGARGAYQAGVLAGIAELLGPEAEGPLPFTILSGESAGAINSCRLGSLAARFGEAAGALYEDWRTIRFEDVYRTDSRSLLQISARWLRDLSLGGVLGSSRAVNLLDTRPLEEFLRRRIDFDEIRRCVAKGILDGVSVTSTNYATGIAFSFFEAPAGVAEWERSSRMGQRATLTLEHVLASSAIPLFFPPVRLRESFFCDGTIGQQAPLSPAIHLGADRIVAIGLRQSGTEPAMRAANLASIMGAISLADIAGALLNAGFLDHLEPDVERALRINATLALMTQEQLGQHPSHLRYIPLFVVRPSRDLGLLASEQFDRFSPMLRYLLRGLGASRARGWDLLSYLAFDTHYTSLLLELGRSDALLARDAILPFLSGE